MLYSLHVQKHVCVCVCVGGGGGGGSIHYYLQYGLDLSSNALSSQHVSTENVVLKCYSKGWMCVHVCTSA